MKISKGSVTFDKLHDHLGHSFLVCEAWLAVCRTSLSRTVPESSSSASGLPNFSLGPGAVPRASTVQRT